ncbi:oligopeptide ABC transporter permease [Roseateles oligotrophus]|uniref:ABC transporter permease n=1 Tax=Roseateles oligotrophus TaxID=1769250 RepID=A0ABT2YK31_9BURK|nr:oligopeptide ABC transporter permease [Roseateles oligotrophus]MCV2370403.1 ABC transporter permease [Roseateles oligotrophus]
MNSSSLTSAKWRKFKANKLAMLGLGVFTLITLACLFSRLIFAFDPNAIDLDSVRLPPSSQHWLGTDQIGRDMLARTMAAGQISLLVGACSVLLALVIGTLLGGVAGYFGGWVDKLIMRFVDLVMTFPPIIVLMTLAAVIGSGTAKTIFIIGLLSWPLVCRLVRARILSVREMEFVAAAKTLGAGHGYILFKHLLPNTTDVLVVFSSLGFVSAIMAEAGLSFLGLGVQQPDASWGSLISIARESSVLKQYPWIWLPSGIFIITTALCVNFIGDGLRQAFDPKTIKE